jgi:superfamily II DNA or RNA helicase
MTNLREWQREALNQYIGHDRADFLLEATPGAGKTRFAAEAAMRLKEAGLIKRIVVVVPTTALREQTARAFAACSGLQLHYAWENNGPMPSGQFDGVVVTYSAVASIPDLYRHQIGRIATLAILDEVHHANKDKSWGAALRTAFDPAVKRLLLSGTPFRSDNGAIPFVRYVDGRGQTDFSLSYGEALSNGVVRSVFFPRRGGRMEWMESGSDDSKVATFGDDLDEAGQSRRLRTALMTGGGHLIGMLGDAHRELVSLRQDDSDTGGLVIAMDQEHALRIATQMTKELGIKPVVAISDDPNAGDVIRAFANSADPWIVAVKMVSEGVDIPRLRVCVYATNLVTEMFFRQAVGRVVRVQPGHEDHSAFVFIPDDPRLRQFAQQIKEQREATLDELDEQEREQRLKETPTIGLFLPLTSTSTDEGVIAGEHSISPSELVDAEKIKLRQRETASMPTPLVALLLREARTVGQPTTPSSKQSSTDSLLADRVAKLKEANYKAVNKVAFYHGIEPRIVNVRLNQLVGIGSIKSCYDESVLGRRLQLAQTWLRDGEIREARDA